MRTFHYGHKLLDSDYSLLEHLPLKLMRALLAFPNGAGKGKVSYEQYARTEGIPIGTVRSRLSRARNALDKLREHIEVSSAHEREQQ